MRVGTKSLLFGYHQFVLHPLMVATAWWKLYGFPMDPRIWVAFVVHDVGYFGKPNMDGTEGKLHPFSGANLMHFFFDRPDECRWYHFSLYHSRSVANAYFAPVSDLCYADKLAFLYYPEWLLKILYRFSGEGKEYRSNENGSGEMMDWDEWYAKVSMKNTKHVDGRPNS